MNKFLPVILFLATSVVCSSDAEIVAKPGQAGEYLKAVWQKYVSPSLLEKEGHPIASGMLHKTADGRVYLPSQDAFGVGVNLDEDIELQVPVQEVVASKSVAAVEQAPEQKTVAIIKSEPKKKAVEQEKISWLTQISENPVTTAALTAGTVVVLYGSYKLIQYFDQKKAKRIALAKRLQDQRDHSSVVFE